MSTANIEIIHPNESQPRDLTCSALCPPPLSPRHFNSPSAIDCTINPPTANVPPVQTKADPGQQHHWRRGTPGEGAGQPTPKRLSRGTCSSSTHQVIVRREVVRPRHLQQGALPAATDRQLHLYNMNSNAGLGPTTTAFVSVDRDTGVSSLHRQLDAHQTPLNTNHLTVIKRVLLGRMIRQSWHAVSRSTMIRSSVRFRSVLRAGRG